MPAEGYDPRADFFARLRVGEAELDSIRALRQLGAPIGQQPITVACAPSTTRSSKACSYFRQCSVFSRVWIFWN